jgi:hypothetical protein
MNKLEQGEEPEAGEQTLVLKGKAKEKPVLRTQKQNLQLP